MIPIRDENPTRRVPFVNYALIVINVLVFLWQVSLGPSSDVALYQLALIPLDVTSGFDMGDVRSVFTSMFMHAGLMHLLGNMLYLWIFGDNVEDMLGHFRYLLFYLAGGFAASLTYVFSTQLQQFQRLVPAAQSLLPWERIFYYSQTVVW